MFPSEVFILGSICKSNCYIQVHDDFFNQFNIWKGLLSFQIIPRVVFGWRGWNESLVRVLLFGSFCLSPFLQDHVPFWCDKFSSVQVNLRINVSTLIDDSIFNTLFSHQESNSKHRAPFLYLSEENRVWWYNCTCGERCFCKFTYLYHFLDEYFFGHFWSF